MSSGPCGKPLKSQSRLLCVQEILSVCDMLPRRAALAGLLPYVSYWEMEKRVGWGLGGMGE